MHLSDLLLPMFKFFISGLLRSWWIWLILLFILIAPVLIERRKNNKRYSLINKAHTDRELINKLRNITPQEFEIYIANLFSKLGFFTEIVGGSHDGGVDIIAIKNNIKHYIQCKKFIKSQVGVGDVRDFYGALIDHLASGKGYFITTNKFTLEAEKFSEDKPIELIDSYRLLEYIKLAEVDDFLYNSNNQENKCPQCEGFLVRRIGKYGPFFGCKNYPKCKFIKKIEK